jgi:hypothetical protein
MKHSKRVDKQRLRELGEKKKKKKGGGRIFNGNRGRGRRKMRNKDILRVVKK